MLAQKQRPATEDRIVRSARSRAGDLGDGGLAIAEASGALVHTAPPAVTGSLRYLVARIQSSIDDEIPSRLALTSALSGEGVTFVTRSLAAVLCNDLGHRVCLVDVNWWSPSTWPGPSDRPGVADVIRSTARLSDAIIQTSNPKLAIVPAGVATVSDRPILASSAGLETLLTELDARFDHLLLDVPAVLPVSESRILAGLADAHILVVRHGVTADHQVREAASELRHLDTAGVILNRSRSRVPKWILNLISP